MADNRYSVDYGKRAANCKRCKQKIEKGELRIAKITANPFSDEGEMKHYHHPKCIFESFKRAKANTRIIEEPGDIEDFKEIKEDDQETIRALIKEHDNGGSGSKKKTTTPKKETKQTRINDAFPKTPTKNEEVKAADDKHSLSQSTSSKVEPHEKDDSFREFRRLCAEISDKPAYNDKIQITKRFFDKGTDGKQFKGDLTVWIRLLLPKEAKRIYNIQSKQMVKLFSRIFRCSEEDMLEDLSAGDVADTVSKFFENSDSKVKPSKKSKLSVHDVDDFLNRMAKLTKEDEQQAELCEIARRCTVNDLKMVVRLLKHDLCINAGPKHILGALHQDAYESFNSSRNLQAVVDKIVELRRNGNPHGCLEVGISLMHPVQPMLCLACSSVDMAFNKLTKGMYAEVKYDGERVQLHKKGNDFKYFSRSLKPVLAHKIRPFAEYIPKAFPDGSDLILDAEVLMIDSETGKPLPFGSLGKHKSAEYKNAIPCLFVFDCIYYNGKSLMNKTVRERKSFLEEHMKEVNNHVKFSEYEVITKKEQLGNKIKEVLKLGLEGLVLKGLESTYAPGKRYWLKVKKDYLNEGALADTADLVVLGAWYGTGQKGGLKSVFLMGCFDEDNQRWCTVTKVHTGLDDATLEKLQGTLQNSMVKIKKDHSKIPSWLQCTRAMTPDFVAKDPKTMPVWEITGAEFTKAAIHTADGISIRFPRITRRREDKDWKTATTLEELKYLFKVSKESNDYDIDYSSKSETSSQTSGKSNGGQVKEEDLEGLDDSFEKEDSELSTPKKRKLSQSDSSHSGSSSKKRKMEKEDHNERETEDENHGIKGEKKINGADLPTDKRRIKTEYGFEMDVVVGDLFQGTEKVSLAHCVSQDLKLGKGIAKQFKNKFGRINELKKSGAKVGDIAVLKDKNRYIYNLVTKEKFHDKPTYETLQRSLEAMRDHAIKQGVREIAMPLIGCGLDGLHWNAVRTLIKNVFLREKMHVTVYTLDDTVLLHSPKPLSPHKVLKQIKEPKGFQKTSDSKQRSIEEYTEKNRSEQKNNESSDEASSSQLGNELPDIFADWKVLFLDGVKDLERLERYTIAYGGEVLRPFESDRATHVIYPAETKSKMKGAPKKAKHVLQEFMIDSIKLKEVQNEQNYIATK